MPDTVLVLVVILVLAVIWRGPKNLPRIGEMLGRGVREARREAAATRDEFAGRDDAPANDADEPPPDRR
jgi:Sec-independent protein translocase protein TatA